MWYDGYFLIDLQNCKSSKKLTKMKNNSLLVTTFMRLFDTAMQRYKLEGLPDTVQERVVLQSLIMYGCVVFFDENGSILALPGVPSGDGYNINGDPVSAWVYSRNGLFNREVKLIVPGGKVDPMLELGVNKIPADINKNTGVIVWENKNRFPFVYTILYYATAIADTLRTIDVARMWLKTPFIPVCEESLADSVRLTLKDIQENDEMIPVSTGVLDIKRFSILPVQESGESISHASELVDWYEQQYRSACGIRSNTNMDKKGENLISDEIHVNDSYTDSLTDSLAEYLQSQLDLVNEVFGTEIRVQQNESYQSDSTEAENEDDKNVKNDKDTE